MHTDDEGRAGSRRGSGRGVLAGAMLALGALVLSSCGAGVTTELDLEDESSGVRTMHATISAQELEDEEIAVEDVEAAITEHLPEGLEFDGTEISERDDGEYVQATFTLPFDSVEDYESTADSVLQAGGVDLDAEVTFEVPDSALVSGLTLEENFSSMDLLSWLPEALVAEGAVDESDEGSVFESDEGSEVTFDGETYEVGSSQISVQDVQDDGFAQLRVETTMHEDSTFSTEIHHYSDEVISTVRMGLIEEYFDGATPEGAELTRGVPESSGYPDGMTLSFDSADLESLSAALQTATGSEDSGLMLEESAADGDPTRFTLEVSGSLDDSSSTSLDSVEPDFVLTLPEDWEPSGEGTSSGAQVVVDDSGAPTVEAQGETFSATLERSVPLKAVQVETALGFLGGITQTFEFTAAGEAVDQVGDSFEEVLAPPESVGTLEASEEDGDTVYTVVVEADDAEDLTGRLQEWVPGASVVVREHEGFSLAPAYDLKVEIPLRETLLQSGVTDSYAHTLELPATHSFREDEFRTAGMEVSGGTLTVGGELGDGEEESGDADAGGDGAENGDGAEEAEEDGDAATTGDELREDFAATASGFSLMGLLVLGGILLVVVVLAAVLLVVFRRRAKSRKGRVAADEQSAADQAPSATAEMPSVGPAAGAGAGAAAGSAAAHDDESSEEASDDDTRARRRESSSDEE